MRKHSNIRMVNGMLSAAIVCFFVAHGILGSISAIAPFESGLAWTIWIGVACIAVHVVVSIATSWEQLHDPDNPPSDRKKQHLALKWATGLLLLASVAVHVAFIRIYGAAATQSMATGAFVIIFVAVMFAYHACVGGKSLLKDILVDRKYLTAYRVIVCTLAIVFIIASIAGVVT